jgi:hypothetical protein
MGKISAKIFLEEKIVWQLPTKCVSQYPIRNKQS